VLFIDDLIDFENSSVTYIQISDDLTIGRNGWEGGRKGLCIRDGEKGKKFVVKQKAVLHQLQSLWADFISSFKRQCRAYCSGVEEDFEPLLQDILSNEDFSFPWYEDLFQEHIEQYRDPGTERVYEDYRKGYSLWLFPKIGGLLSLRKRLHILQEGQAWIQRFLSTIYELYQKIPRAKNEGVFLRTDSTGEADSFSREVYSALSAEKFFYLEHLSTSFRYGSGNPFSRFVREDKMFDVPLDARIAHIDICAGSGHGKTWLLQSLITDTLSRGYGFLVMDSQGALIPKILALKPLLQKEVIYINPEDREYVPGITFFGASLRGIEDNEQMYNTLLSFYKSIFSDLMGSGLTEKQEFIFSYVTQLLLTVPHATLFTFIDVLTNGDKYLRYIQQLPPTVRYVFENQFFEKTYDHTKQEITRKLLGLVKIPTIDRILNNTEQRIDFHKAMNEGAVILINTSKDFLQDLSSFFGKFLLGMLYTNVMKRNPDGRDPPFFFFIDEAQEYFLKGMGGMFSQFRKFNVGLTIAHQNLGQLKAGGIDADVRASTAVKIVGSPNKEDKTVFAAEMRVNTDFIDACKKHKSEGYSEWACFIQHEMDKAVKMIAPWFAMDKLPKMSADEQKAMLERNRERYCVKVDGVKPAQAHSTAPQAPPDQPKPAGSWQSPEQSGRDDSIWD
jgi:hypothetical protein